MTIGHHDTDPELRALAVLTAALQSPGRGMRRRAVAMLAHVDCEHRISWLEVALSDADEAVRATALAVLAWVLPAQDRSWPAREACDREGRGWDTSEDVERAGSHRARQGWEYAVEVWRSDGLLIGVYAVTTCGEDDPHARSIALGQAILANAGQRGDQFDPATSAMFIVSKCRRAIGDATREPPPPGPCDGRQA